MKGSRCKLFGKANLNTELKAVDTLVAGDQAEVVAG